MKNNKIIKKHTAECVCLYGVYHMCMLLLNTYTMSLLPRLYVCVLSNIMSIL